MNLGKSFRDAVKQAIANSARTGLVYFLHSYNGVYWLGKSRPRGAMATIYTEVRPDGTYHECQPNA